MPQPSICKSVAGICSQLCNLPPKPLTMFLARSPGFAAVKLNTGVIISLGKGLPLVWKPSSPPTHSPAPQLQGEFHLYEQT